MTNPPTPQDVTLREALEPFAKLFQSLQSKHDGPMPTTFEAIISTADVQRAAYAFADLSHPPAPEQASVEHHVTLRDALQNRCYEWGTYWRSSDAHGVKLNTEQALELLRDALGVEVEIAATPTAEPAVEAVPSSCAECGKTSTKDSMWALYCLDCIQGHGISLVLQPGYERLINKYIEDYEFTDGDSGYHEPSDFEQAMIKDAFMGFDFSSLFSASPAAPEAAKPETQRERVELRNLLNQYAEECMKMFNSRTGRPEYQAAFNCADELWRRIDEKLQRYEADGKAGGELDAALEWAAGLAVAERPQSGDWLYDDREELAKAIRAGITRPQQAAQAAQPLTYDQLSEICPGTVKCAWSDAVSIARAVEQAHGIGKKD